MSRKNRIWLVAILAIGILPIAAWYIADPHAMRSHLVSHSDFRRLPGRLFVSPSFDDADSEHLAGTIKDAESRVGELFGRYSADPWIIVAADPESARRYSFNLHATIHPSPFGRAYVVLGPEGLSDIDVVAHELAHAEHLERVGILLWWLTPAWFREGLAMQVDHRTKYGESALLRAIQAGEPVPNVQEMISFRQFSRGNLPLNYAAARRAVATIYHRLGPSGLSSLLRQQRLGRSFTGALKEAGAKAPDS